MGLAGGQGGGSIEQLWMAFQWLSLMVLDWGGGVQQILVAADGLCLREREAGGLLRGVAERA